MPPLDPNPKVARRRHRAAQMTGPLTPAQVIARDLEAPGDIGDESPERPESSSSAAYIQPALFDDIVESEAATAPEPIEGGLQNRTTAFEARVGLARSKIEGATRDELGFSTPGVAITAEQLRWLTHRVDAENDKDADEAAHIDSVKRNLWMKGAEFRAFYETCRDDKREGLRLLGAQMLPTALRVLLDLLNGDNLRGKLGAANLLLRTQGMLVDKVVRADPDQLSQVMAQLREPRLPRIITGPYSANNTNDRESDGEYMGGEYMGGGSPQARGLPNHHFGGMLGLESELEDGS